MKTLTKWLVIFVYVLLMHFYLFCEGIYGFYIFYIFYILCEPVQLTVNELQIMWSGRKSLQNRKLSIYVFLGAKLVSSRTRHRSTISTACPMPKLKNGFVRMQRGGRMGYFFCANEFDIHGPMNIVCQNARWKQELPKCLSNINWAIWRFSKKIYK